MTLRSLGRDEALVTVCALLLLLGLAQGLGFTHGATLMTRTIAYALAAVSLSFLIGQCGLVSFGHAAPFGIGAYAVLIAGEAGIREILVVLPLAAGAAALFCGLTGAIALRTRGVYFIMITLAFAQMAFYVAASLSDYGGDDGMAINGRSTFLGIKVLRSETSLTLLCIAMLGLALFMFQRLSASRFGLMLRAARANESKVVALGLAPYRHRLIALSVAGAVAGLAGALLANQVEYVSPALMGWHISGELIVMVVLGGIGRPVGAVIGALVVTLLDESLGHLTEHWRLGLGLVIILVALMRDANVRSLLRGAVR
ncbi:branched-chain amino acid ABC transporter permease [Aquabacter sp. L1I39]|uniref:branched-chain amino acid ABC transporter permease n=1 Tax=Aquabacter sp. L1I39 TaxID=2820278 RepID=UPI001ADA35E5|nr:branched-chain amino acid ABC transporter permease [Aquabacter sp. L1I39]QTL05705.1 branched-chain amino acid ABC transporter permease [Aquabacter sp. L1I39]